MTSGTAHFTAIPSVSLADQFDTTTATVQKPKDICPPANKNNEGVLDPVTHQEAYLADGGRIEQRAVAYMRCRAEIRGRSISPDGAFVLGPR